MTIFNALIACALTYPDMDIACPEYICPYYHYVLEQFSRTLFGQVVLVNTTQLTQITDRLAQSYNSDPDSKCAALQASMAKRIEVLTDGYIEQLLDGPAPPEIRDWASYSRSWEAIRIQNAADPFYLKCVKFLEDPKSQQLLDYHAEGIIEYFYNT